MRNLLILMMVCVTGCSWHKKPIHSAARADELEPGLGNHYHPTSTQNPKAQRLFDQGLTLSYAFNHDAALAAFRKAQQIDPSFAMAHWGAAMVLGPNYYWDVDAEHEKMAYDEVTKAVSLSAGAGGVPQQEKDYINALAKRYTNAANADLPKLAKDYANAMRDLMKKYPDDLDAATLFAEAMMDLRPWKLWTADHKPAPGTEEIVAVLESVLKRDPDHVGANHLYIHAVEASPHPEIALESAGRLPALAPACGHLVHMPAHIYQRTGDYEASAGSNEAAVEADQVYLKRNPEPGLYSMMYYSHNLHFLCVAQMMQGRQHDALEAADKLAAHVAPHVAHMPMLEGFLVMPTLVMVRFQRYGDVLRIPQPPAEQKISAALRHYARGMAMASRDDPTGASAEREQLRAATDVLPADMPFGALNNARTVLGLARHVLEGRMALARGDKKAAIAALRQAVSIEDSLSYDEPPTWPIPVREALGMVQMKSGDFAAAEKTFREDLDRNPRSGRSLFGLREALRAQNKTYEAQLVDRRYQEAWKNADGRLKMTDLF